MSARRGACASLVPLGFGVGEVEGRGQRESLDRTPSEVEATRAIDGDERGRAGPASVTRVGCVPSPTGRVVIDVTPMYDAVVR